MSPLFSALLGEARVPKLLVWMGDLLNAFLETRVSLVGAAMLTHPHKDAPTPLTTDALDEAVGAVLQQQVRRAWLLLAFFSKQLHPTKKQYSAFDKELLALYLGIQNLNYFLKGQI